MTWMFGHELRLEGHGIDRAPAGGVGGAGDLGDAAGPLRRDDVGDIGGVVAELGDDGAGRGIDRGHPAALRQRDPFDHAGIELLPGLLEQPLLGESCPWRRGSAPSSAASWSSDNARSGWRARRAPGGQREGLAGTAITTSAAVLHRLELPAQQQRLLAGLPGVRHLRRRRPRHSRAARRSGSRCRARAPAGRRRATCRRRASTLRACGSMLSRGLRDHGDAARRRSCRSRTAAPRSRAGPRSPRC